MSKKHDEINDSFKALKKEFDAKIKNEFRPTLEKLMSELIPEEFKEIRVSGYTPYFNDGDECHYFMEEIHCKLNKSIKRPKKALQEGDEVFIKALDTRGTVEEIKGKDVKIYFPKIDDYLTMDKDSVSKLEGADEDNNEDEEGFVFYDDLEGTDLKKADDINDFFQDLDVDLIKSVYGDHKTFYISKKGVKVKNYTDHD
jgi:hypothetical protein